MDSYLLKQVAEVGMSFNSCLFQLFCRRLCIIEEIGLLASATPSIK